MANRKSRSSLAGVLSLGAALALGGCTSISGNLAADASGALGVQFTKDLQSASWDLDQAVLVGALDATDPAPACLHSALAELGIGAVAPSFTAKNDGIVSLGAILYIRAQQAKKLSGGITLPVSCKAIIGQVVMDAAAAGKNLLPGSGFLPTIK